MYRALGFAHATAHHHARRLLAPEAGQGTIEYVGLVALIAAIMVLVVAAGKKSDIAGTIVRDLRNAIDHAASTS